MEAGKVDIISSPSRFTIQQEPAKPKADVNNNEKNVSWKTIGLISSAIMATVLGGIYYAKHHSVPKNISTAVPDIAGGSDTPTVFGKFELDLKESVLQFFGKGKKPADNSEEYIAFKNTFLKKVKLKHVIDENKIIWHDEANEFMQFIDKTENSRLNLKIWKPKNVTDDVIDLIETYSGGLNCEYLNLLRKKDSSILSINDLRDTYNYKIEFNEKTGQIIKASSDTIDDIPKEEAQKLIKDFDINKYISSKEYRDEYAQRFTIHAFAEPISKKTGISADEIIKLQDSPEFKSISNYMFESACITTGSGKAIKTLEDIFSITYTHEPILARPNTVFALLRDGGKIHGADISTIEADVSRGHIKIPVAIILEKHTLGLDPSGKLVLKETRLPKLECSEDGRFLRYSKSSEFEMQSYTPVKITETTPKETSYEGLKGCCYIKEYDNKKIIEIINEDKKRVVLSYDTKTKKINPDECYAEVFNQENSRVDLTGKESILKDIYGTFNIANYSTNNTDYIHTNNYYIAKLFE